MRMVWARLFATVWNARRRLPSVWRLWLALRLPFPAMAGGAAETATTFDRVLKDFYAAQGIVNQVNIDTFLLDKVKKAKRFQIMGRNFYKPARFGLSGGVGSRGENVALPTPDTQTFDDILIPIRYHYGVVQWTGPLQWASQGEKAAFANAMEQIMSGMYDEFQLVTSILLYGWGTGIIGVVSSVAASVITLSDDIHPITWFYEGLKIDSYQSNESTLRQANMKVTAVDISARTVTVDTIGATAATDRLYLAGSRNVVPMGLLGIVDDSTYVDTLFGIQRTAAGRGRWKSYIDTQSGGAPTKYGSATRRPAGADLIQKVLDNQRVRAGASRGIDQIVSSLGVRRGYWLSLVGDRRYNSGAFDGGWENLVYQNGDRKVLWFGDEFCQRYTAFGLHTKATPAPQGQKSNKVADEEILGLYENRPADWDSATGSKLKQVYSGADLVDAVTAFLVWYFNFAGCRPNVHARVDDLTEPTS